MNQLRDVPTGIQLELFGFLNRRDLAVGLAQVSKNTRKLAYQSLWPSIKKKVIHLLERKKNCEDLSEDEKAALPYFQAPFVLPQENFLKIFHQMHHNYRLELFSKEYPYLKDLLIESLLYHFFEFIINTSTLVSLCRYFPEKRKIFIEKILNEEPLIEKIIPCADTLINMLDYFSDFTKQIMSLILENEKHFTRIFAYYHSLEKILHKAPDYISPIMKLILENKEHFNRIFPDRFAVERIIEMAASNYSDAIQEKFREYNGCGSPKLA